VEGYGGGGGGGELIGALHKECLDCSPYETRTKLNYLNWNSEPN
jgi:hypothetical protein